MADDTGILEAITAYLRALVTPRSAEAKVLPGDAATAEQLQALEALNQAHQGQYIYDMYARILRQAQARPESVTLSAQPGLFDARKAVGIYRPDDKQIVYEPRAELENAIPHELLHFLSDKTTPGMTEAAQHALIKKVLGADVYTPPALLRAYQPPPLSPEEQGILDQWLGGRR